MMRTTQVLVLIAMVIITGRIMVIVSVERVISVIRGRSIRIRKLHSVNVRGLRTYRPRIQRSLVAPASTPAVLVLAISLSGRMKRTRPPTVVLEM